tara:strand:- start:90 stop:488 length:399 start_codon:yes stop_codon:yes gene_type:complete
MGIIGVSNAVSVGSTINFISPRDFYIYSGLKDATTVGATFVDINLPIEAAKLDCYLSVGGAQADNVFWQISMDGSEVARITGRYGNGSHGELPTLPITLVSSGDTKLLIKGVTSSGDFDNCSVVIIGRTLNA